VSKSMVRFAGWLAFSVALLVGCGAGEQSGTGATALTIAKSPGKSGDVQIGAAAQRLSSPLRVYVTRDGQPAEGEQVTWSTGSGGSLSLNPSQTDGTGIAVSFWTLGPSEGGQTAQATLADASGSPITFTATATSQDGGQPPGQPPPGGY
jgi:hypothetical protein